MQAFGNLWYFSSLCVVLFSIFLAADSYTVDGSVSLTTTDTTNCPTAESDIAVTVYNPTFNGAVEISGEIRGDDATIKSVNITEFKVTCDSVNTTYSPPLPDSLQDATQFVNDNVSTFVKEFLSGEYIETFRGWVEAALNGLSRAWSYLTGVTWLARFARANAATSVTNFLKFGFGLGN